MSSQLKPYLPYGRQWVDEDDIQAVVDVLRSDFLTTGPAVGKLEAAITGYSGAKHALVVNSGTSALHAAYFGCGLGAGDEIITSPMTFAATGNAALYLGATVKFVDVEPETGNIDASLIEEAIGSKTKLLCPIDFTGHPADYDPINKIAARNNLKVVADAAHSFGASYNGQPVGTLADATEISMHPVKPFTTGEGGAVLTDDDEIASRVAMFRTHGITRDKSIMRSTSEGEWFYEMQELGFNYRLTDIQCALGIAQMSKIDKFISRRRQIAARYTEALKDVQELVLPTVRPGVEPAWHLFMLRIRGDKSLRRPFFENLREKGLGVQVHYVPVYLHPYYQDLGFKRGLCPIAEDFYERSVSVPIFPMMSDDDVDSSVERIIAAVREVL